LNRYLDQKYKTGQKSSLQENAVKYICTCKMYVLQVLGDH